MGKIELDHTGSGGGITLSSDGTDLLLGGTAIGGSALELYAENPSTPTAPSATGTNAVAIGNNASSSNTLSVAIGHNSVASNDYAFAIGAFTDATGERSLALGYLAQAVTGQYATAISRSYASGTDSFAAAIANNTSSYGATGTNSIAMGYQAKATGSYGIAIGLSATASGPFHTLALGGNGSIASASYATAINGGNVGNEATQSGAFAFGRGAKAAIQGKFAFANDRFSLSGDAQGGMYILRADTTDATATVLTTNNNTAGSTNQIVAASDTCITFDGTITAMQNGAQAYASWRIEGLLVNDGGTTTLANSATTIIDNQSSWGMALSADNTNNALAITVTGEASHNIRWVANIRTTEVTYA